MDLLIIIEKDVRLYQWVMSCRQGTMKTELGCRLHQGYSPASLEQTKANTRGEKPVPTLGIYLSPKIPSETFHDLPTPLVD